MMRSSARIAKASLHLAMCAAPRMCTATRAVSLTQPAAYATHGRAACTAAICKERQSNLIKTDFNGCDRPEAYEDGA